jgi:hypothetical protein
VIRKAGLPAFRLYDLLHNAGFRIMPGGLNASTFFQRDQPDRPLIDPA